VVNAPAFTGAPVYFHVVLAVGISNVWLL